MNRTLADQSIYQQRLIDHRRLASRQQRSYQQQQQRTCTPEKEMQCFADPPLDLSLASSLNDSFGWDEAPHEDNDVNDEFEKIYTQDIHEHAAVDYKRIFEGGFDRRIDGENRRPWQKIHRTSFTYQQEGDGRMNGEEETALSSVGLNPYDATFDQGKQKQHQVVTPERSNRQSIFRDEIISPSAVRRQPKLASSNAVSPNTGMYDNSQHLTRHAQPKGILRNPTAISALTQTTISNTSRQRSSSRSLSRKSHSRSDTSRSTSRHRSKNEEHNESLFRGAQLIKEQLIRSMADVDRSRDDTNGRHTMKARQASDAGSIDFDYSHIPPQQRMEVRDSSDPSSIQSRLETESQRLDSLIKIFAQGSFVSSTTTPSNELKEEEWDDRGAGNSTASPKTTCVDLNQAEAVAAAGAAPTKSYFKQTSDDSNQVGYANRYLHEHQPTDNNTIVYTDSPIVNSKHLHPQPAILPSPSQHDLAAQYQSQKQHRLVKQADDALTHARSAGSLWRSLVGNHVRFPSSWDNLLPPTAPHIAKPNHKWSKWYYPARHRVRGDRKLNSAEFGVRNRRSGGRILMNVLVREMHSPHVCREVVVGCFHPNAKGIRVGEVDKDVEDVREVWMGVRWVIPVSMNEPELAGGCNEEDVECFIDGFLTQKRQMLDYQTMGSPLGRRKAVNNENVRAVFGDEPPLTTVNLYEDELAEIIKAKDTKRLSALPGLMLLKLFLFSK